VLHSLLCAIFYALKANKNPTLDGSLINAKSLLKEPKLKIESINNAYLHFKWIGMILIMVCLVALYLYTNESEDIKIVLPVPEHQTIDYTQLPLIGDDTDVLKVQAFDLSPANLSSKSIQWQEQGISYENYIKQADLVISLEQQLYDLLKDHVAEFAKKHDIVIALRKGTCGISARKLGAKSIDIGGFCCPPVQRDRLPNLTFHTLGISALGIYAHRNNPITQMTLEQVRNVFRGRLQEWSQLGVSNEDIHLIMPITRRHCKVRPGHWRLILKDAKDFSVNSRDLGDISATFKQISRYPDTIGFETLFMAAREKTTAKTVLINGVSPANLDALAKGVYPFYRVFNVTTWEGTAKNPLADKLVQFLKDIVVEYSNDLLMVSAQQLRENGWVFRGGELVGEPSKRVSSF